MEAVELLRVWKLLLADSVVDRVPCDSTWNWYTVAGDKLLSVTECCLVSVESVAVLP